MKSRERIIEAYNEYVAKHGEEPNAVGCEVRFKDDGSEWGIIIKLNCECDESTDDHIFYYCNHLHHLLSLMDEDNNSEDFNVIEVYEFINIKDCI